MRLVPCAWPAASKTSRAKTYVRRTEKRILLVSQSKRRICHFHKMCELRQERKSIEIYETAPVISVMQTTRMCSHECPKKLFDNYAGNPMVIVMIDRFSSLMLEVPIANTSAKEVASIFLDNCIVRFGIPSYVLPDDCLHFVSKFFEAFSWYLGVNHVTTTSYQPQTNTQIEWYNKTIVAGLRQYAAKNQRNWDIFVKPLTHDHNKHGNRNTNTTPYSLVLSRLAPRPSLLIADSNRLCPAQPETLQQTNACYASSPQNCDPEHDLYPFAEVTCEMVSRIWQ